MLCFYKYYLQFCKTVHEMFLQEFKKVQISHSVCVLLSAGSSLPRVYGGFKKGTREGEESNQHMASIAMIVICSHSQVQSVFIQLVFFSKSNPQFGMQVGLES